MLNKITIVTLSAILFLAPTVTLALNMPQSGNELADMANLNSKAYIVQDLNTGQIIISKNENLLWTPASLTKLVTALVVLDTNTKLTKQVTMTQDDQNVGACKSGGACIKSKAGVKFTVDSLFHAALLPSANNAANALARSTGLSAQEFVDRMNKKATELGATQSHFNEPTGLDPSNQITAADYSKIVTAAFSNDYLRKVAGLNTYYLRSSNNSKYNQTIKNTDKLLADADLTVLGAKTGYLNESNYNFATLIKYKGGQELAIVVLGEQHLYSAFSETKQLVAMGEQARDLALINNMPAVLGTSTVATINSK